MKSLPRNPIRRLPALAALAVFAAACASGPVSRKAAKEAPRLYGIAGDRLVHVDPATGASTAVTRAPEIRDVGALAYDPGLDTFYAIADARQRPRLIAIDRETGDVTSIGWIDLPGVDLTIAEGLAFDPRSGRLLAAAGRSKFASNRLLELDAATAGATDIAPIRGTRQDDVDAMTFVGGRLYAADSAGGSTTLYTIDPDTGEAAATGTAFRGVVTGLAADGRRLVAAVEGSARPVVVQPAGGEVAALGAAADVDDPGTVPLTALAFAHLAAAGGALPRDDFESGDLSAWSATAKGGGR